MEIVAYITADVPAWKRHDRSPLEKIDPTNLPHFEDSILREFEGIDMYECYGGLGEKIRDFSEKYHLNFPSEPRPFAGFPDLQKITSQHAQQQEKLERERNIRPLASLLGYIGVVGAFIGGAVEGGELWKENGKYIALTAAAISGLGGSGLTLGLFSYLDRYLLSWQGGRRQKIDMDFEQQMLDALQNYKSQREQ